MCDNHAMSERRPATREYHPARVTPGAGAPLPPPRARFDVPRDADNVEVEIGGRAVRLTNLSKPFWPALGITKRDLLQYYADVAPALLPHLRDRAMVMKRYPNGAEGDFFFMKRAPKPRPEWLSLCSIEHTSANVIDCRRAICSSSASRAHGRTSTGWCARSARSRTTSVVMRTSCSLVPRGGRTLASRLHYRSGIDRCLPAVQVDGSVSGGECIHSGVQGADRTKVQDLTRCPG